MANLQVRAIVNGQEVTLAYNASSGKYEGSLSAPTKSTHRMRREESLTGTAVSGNLELTISTASDQDVNFTTVYKNGVPLPDTSIVFLSSTKIRVNGRTDTGGWAVEYRTNAAVDGGTNGNYNVYVEATDLAGNVSHKSFTDDTRLWVREKTLPTITNLSPAASAKINNAKPTFSGNFADNDSGINTNSFKLTIDKGLAGERVVEKGSTGLTLTTTGFSYVPPTALSEGTHTYEVQIADNDGNVRTSSSISITIDTIPPALNVTSPVDGLITNQSSCVVAGTVESGTTITIRLNGADQGTVTNNNGNFSKTVTLANGSNTIVVRSTDSATNFTEITRTVTLDTVPPTISSIELVPNPVDGGATLIIRVTASD